MMTHSSLVTASNYQIKLLDDLDDGDDDDEEDALDDQEDSVADLLDED